VKLEIEFHETDKEIVAVVCADLVVFVNHEEGR